MGDDSGLIAEAAPLPNRRRLVRLLRAARSISRERTTGMGWATVDLAGLLEHQAVRRIRGNLSSFFPHGIGMTTTKRMRILILHLRVILLHFSTPVRALGPTGAKSRFTLGNPN